MLVKESSMTLELPELLCFCQSTLEGSVSGRWPSRRCSNHFCADWKQNWKQDNIIYRRVELGVGGNRYMGCQGRGGDTEEGVDRDEAIS